MAICGHREFNGGMLTHDRFIKRDRTKVLLVQTIKLKLNFKIQSTDALLL